MLVQVDTSQTMDKIYNPIKIKLKKFYSLNLTEVGMAKSIGLH